MKKIKIGTHIFGRGSPINMWSTVVLDEIEDNIDNVIALGFESIVLLIPWSCFQPDVYRTVLDDEYMIRLKKLLSIAQQKNVKVILRIGYLWDSTPSNMFTYERFMRLPFDTTIKKNWCWFLKALFAEVKDYNSFDFAFLSWEDFYWPIYRHYSNVKNDEELLPFLHGSGLWDHFSEMKYLSTYTEEKIEIADYQEMLDPNSDNYGFYTNYYDNIILRKIIDISAMSFPGIEFEYRVDPEWIKSEHHVSYHNWNTNFYKSCLPVIYYHSNIGTKPSNVMDTKQAIYHLKSLLERYSPMKRLGQKLPYIDQLNFFDDTYAEWGKIDNLKEEEYAELIFDTLTKFSSGYAIWGLKDWRKNIIHNPVFERNTEGWVISGNCKIEGNTLTINGKAEIYQEIPHLALENGERFLLLSGEATSDQVVTFTVNNLPPQEVLITEGEFLVREAIAEEGRVSSLKIVVSTDIRISEISIFGRSFSQGFSNESGNLYPVAHRLVELQKKYLLNNNA